MFAFVILSRLFLAYWEMADLLALLCVCSCVFVTLPYGALGQVWCLIVPIPDLCLLPYFTFITRYFNGFVLLKQLGNLTCML